MKPRSHSLNHVVCVTMTAIEVTPTISVQMNARTWRDRRATENAGVTVSKSLTDAEVNAPAAGLRLAVHAQVLNRVQLVAEIHTDGTDGREITQTRADRVPEITQVEIP